MDVTAGGSLVCSICVYTRTITDKYKLTKNQLSPECKLQRSFSGERVVFPSDPLVAADAALQRIQPEVGLSFLAVDQLTESSTQMTVLGDVAVVRKVVQFDSGSAPVTLRHGIRHQTVCNVDRIRDVVFIHYSNYNNRQKGYHTSISQYKRLKRA